MLTAVSLFSTFFLPSIFRPLLITPLLLPFGKRQTSQDINQI